ncbi:MAG: prepilin-type N-terminal cleavage/methylation domain-containing protein [Magnetococcales bacterium]|nr:prepilin-type N-terminal cleavage/methylation domain-containing protein [Magnetococcales bacterium]
MPARGFTLLELLLTLMLSAILLLVAQPHWPNALLLSAQAEQLAQDIRYTQALAMQRQQTHTIQWLDHNRYTILDASNQAIGGQAEALSTETSMEPFRCSFAASTGIPNGASQIQLRSGSDTLLLQVSQLTGTVTILP